MSLDLQKIRNEIQSVPIDHVRIEYLSSLLNNLHFTDPYFPPGLSSLYGDSQFRVSGPVVWLRPSEFLKGQIHVFEGGIDNSDIQQGELGDCWLMCTLCALATKPLYITKLFQNAEYNEHNFYRLRLCKDGEWQTVTVDDLIPCSKASKEPVFSRNNGNELWVIILEKAYAKLHGSYLALKGGMAQESFEDLTGCPAFTFYFNKIREKIDSGEFWRDMKTWHSTSQCMLAATSSKASEDAGIVASHYYTVIGVGELRGVKLVNLRNPWGSFEWNGAWSDNSREWTPEFKQYFHPIFDKNDGAFWMTFEDFIKNFQRIVVGHLGYTLEERKKTLIKVNALYGAMPSDYFILDLFEESQIVVELHQEDERSVGVERFRPYLDLGLAILEDGYGLVQYSQVTNQERERQIEARLQPGRYLLVPVSGGSVFRPEGRLPEMPLLSDSGEFDPIFKSTLRDIFRKYDSDLDQVMNCSQFLDFMSRIGLPCDERQFYSVIRNKYTSTDEGLTLQGFYEMFYVALGQYKEPMIRQWLTRLGYDESLYSVESRAVVLSLHSTTNNLRITQAPNNDEVYLKTWSEICKARGESASKLGGVSIYTVKHENGVSIVLYNAGRDNCVMLDTSESQNVNYCIREPVCEIEVPMNTWVIAEHLHCKRSCKRYSYSISSRLA
jgi:calpain-15